MTLRNKSLLTFMWSGAACISGPSSLLWPNTICNMCLQLSMGGRSMCGRVLWAQPEHHPHFPGPSHLIFLNAMCAHLEEKIWSPIVGYPPYILLETLLQKFTWLQNRHPRWLREPGEPALTLPPITCTSTQNRGHWGDHNPKTFHIFILSETKFDRSPGNQVSGTGI